MGGISSSIPALASMAQQAPAPAVTPAETQGIQPVQTTQQISQDAGVQQPQPTPPTSHPIRDLLSNFASQFSMNLGDYLVERGGGSNPRTAQNLADNRFKQQQITNAKAKDLQTFQREGELNQLTAAQTAMLQRRMGMVQADDNVERITNGMIKKGSMIEPDTMQNILKQAPASGRAQQASADRNLAAGYDSNRKPLNWDDLSEPAKVKMTLGQANITLKNAQTEYQQARAAGEPERLKIAESHLGIAAQNLQMRQAEFQQKTQALSPAAQNVLMSTEPLKEQVGDLLKQFSPVKENNTPGYFLKDYAMYKAGMHTDQSELAGQASDVFAQVNMNDIMAAGRLLKGGGGTRSIVALKMALQHTPNMAIDSPQLIHDKLTNLYNALGQVNDSAYKYGAKSGVVGGQSQTPAKPKPGDWKQGLKTR